MNTHINIQIKFQKNIYLHYDWQTYGGETEAGFSLPEKEVTNKQGRKARMNLMVLA